MPKFQKIIQRPTQILFLALCCLLASCSRQYGAYFMRSAAGGSLLAGTQQVVLADSSLARVNEANLRLLAKKQNGQLSKPESDSLRSGLQQLGGHIAAKGHLDKQTKEAYRMALLANQPRPVSTKADRANHWDFAMAGQGTTIGLDANQTEGPLVFGEGKVADEPTGFQQDSDSFYTEQILAALLCVFLGFTGAHRFYLGYSLQGYIQLGLMALAMLIVLVSFVLYSSTPPTLGTIFLLYFGLLVALIPLIPLFVWIFIDFIRIIVGDLRKKPSENQTKPEWMKKY